MNRLSKNGNPSIIHIPSTKFQTIWLRHICIHVEIVYRNGIVYRLSNGSNSVNHLLPANTNKSLLYCVSLSPSFPFFSVSLDFTSFPLPLHFPQCPLRCLEPRKKNDHFPGINKTETRERSKNHAECEWKTQPHRIYSCLCPFFFRVKWNMPL